MGNLQRATFGSAGIVVTALIGLANAGAADVPDDGDRAPAFEVDAGWPKPLPHKWLVGEVNGVAVDRHDTI